MRCAKLPLADAALLRIILPYTSKPLRSMGRNHHLLQRGGHNLSVTTGLGLVGLWVPRAGLARTSMRMYEYVCVETARPS